MDERSEKAFVTVTERETESEQMQKTEYFDFTDLVQDAQNGDQSAFETLYWKSYPFLEREAKKFYTEPADIDDALQETYLRIFQKLDTLKDPRTFLGWAITVCKRTLLNRVEYDERHFGKTELRPETSTEEEQGLDLLPAEEYRRDYDPNSFVDAAHVNDALRDVLNALPEHQQMCILLWSEGYTQREIAEELELPLGTVKSNLNYAKKKMTKVLLRMEKEGTFDYKAVASNPVAAFLYLLERYIEVVPAVPPEAASLFPKIQTAILSGDVAAACSEAVVNTVTKTVAAGTIRSVARKFFTDTGATVTSIMLVIAVAIGTALGIQTVSNPVPAERQNVATTRVSQTQRTTSAESTTARPTGNNGPATNNGAATTPAPVDTVTVRTPAPAATRDNAGNTRSTTAVTVTRADAGLNTPLVARVADVSEVPNGAIYDTVNQAADNVREIFSSSNDITNSIVPVLGGNQSDSSYVKFYISAHNRTGENVYLTKVSNTNIRTSSGKTIPIQDVKINDEPAISKGEDFWIVVEIDRNRLAADLQKEIDEGNFYGNATIEYK